VEPQFEKHSTSRARKVKIADVISLPEALSVIERLNKGIEDAVNQIEFRVA
jgi:hypothetical protein